MLNFEFITVPKVICGSGSLKQIVEALNSLQTRRPMVVTDQGIVNAGLLEKLTEHLSSNVQFVVYADVIADPPEQIVRDAYQLAQQQQCDGIIGFGGGSSLDTAKVIARLACTQVPQDEQDLRDLYGVEQVRGKRLPLILIPTTAGTGSEATPVAVITTGETTKAGIVSPLLLPDVAVLDASLTVGLPRHVTAATGIDAMVHAIEAITSRHKRNPMSHALAIQALEKLSSHIELACENPESHSIRQAMLLGAFWAGQAFANAPVGGVHALAYPLGGHFHIPHGLSNALVLPYVLRFNTPAAKHDYQAVADIMGVSCTPNTSGAALAAYFYELSGKLGIPQTLRDCNIRESHIDMLADDAMLQTRLLVNNPLEIKRDDAIAIYTAALNGDLS
ncbi:iron-containing alcohol dehydrogenase [Alteromonas sp. ASW11-36]|uniref:Iron-containing alcohol dehydrogenase n=1 Tax=Alteromonas arenosi TaxID=3055817 RepID=A0ABT7SW79_9ALTE|nr:iron-containing alcohol dehydrogenase [Alteromonas sp. ASW11-36]MDM7860424.1 iron-containing alcohol dehydrogenase [Alteromonas sp. ASW11-36]